MLFASAVSTLGISAGCGVENDDPVNVPQAHLNESKKVHRRAEFKLREQTLPLAPLRHSGYVRREGLVMGPGLPGWAQISGGAAKGLWEPPRQIEGRLGSWLQGIGGSLRFPVDEEGGTLRRLVIWLKPESAPNAVSLFLNEKPLQTISLKSGWHQYEVRLPATGLPPGEHRLRFWFRQMGHRGKKRYCAAFGALSLLAGTSDANSYPLEGTLGHAGKNHLWAGAPSAWTFYLSPGHGASFEADVKVVDGPSMVFLVKAKRDTQPEQVLYQGEAMPGRPVNVKLSLAAFSGHPMRLTLEAQGSRRSADSAQWLNPRIVSAFPAADNAKETIKNILVWAVDGVRSDRVGLTRDGNFAATPNLDELASAGVRIPEVWVGSSKPLMGHRKILRPAPGGASLPSRFGELGKRTRLWSVSPAILREFSDDFKSVSSIERTDETLAMRSLLGELERWVIGQGRAPFFAYVHTAQPLRPNPVAQSLWRMDQKQVRPRAKKNAGLPGEDRALGAVDYWLGQTLAMLSRRDLLDETLIVVTGTVGRWRNNNRREVATPSTLHVPTVIWSRALARPGGLPALDRGSLAALPVMLMALSGYQAPDNWPGQHEGTRIITGANIRPLPEVGYFSGGAAVRLGRYLLLETSAGRSDLFVRLDDSGAWSALESAYPIARRTLRQAMLSAHD